MQSYHPINDINILITIIRVSPTLSTWKALLSIPLFARYTRADAGRKLSRELFTTIETDEIGTIYRFAGKIHRDNDLPAVIKSDGTQKWYQHGKKHRDNDQPASIFFNSARHWYQHGKLHRDNDKPAVILAHGKQRWYRHGCGYTPAK